MNAQNSDPVRKPRGRPFVKGTAANPGGRPKVVRELLDQCREASPKAIALWTKTLEDKDADMRCRIECSKLIAAYGMGAPPKEPPIERDETDALTDEQLLEKVRLVLAPAPEP